MTTLAQGRRHYPTRSPLRRQDFDPRRDFKAFRLVQLSTIQVEAGQPFPKERVTERLLRQLYDNRQLIMVGDRLPDAINPAMAARRARIVHANKDKPRISIPRLKRIIPRVKREDGGP
jgi:hypothetical protein